MLVGPTIVLAELKTEPEHLPSSFSWHFLCTTVWQTVKWKSISYRGAARVATLLTYALITLLAKAPQKQIAKRAKCGLAKELGHKAVSIYVMGSAIIVRH